MGILIFMWLEEANERNEILIAWGSVFSTWETGSQDPMGLRTNCKSVTVTLEGMGLLETEVQSEDACSISRKRRVHAQLLSRIQSFVTPWTVTHQAPLSMGISQARILEWIALSFSRGSSRHREKVPIAKKRELRQTNVPWYHLYVESKKNDSNELTYKKRNRLTVKTNCGYQKGMQGKDKLGV